MTSESWRFFYIVNTRKHIAKERAEKEFSGFLKRALNDGRKPESKLFLLRVFRLQLANAFCQQVLREVYHDALQLQLLHTTEILKERCFLFPKDVKVFTYGHSELAGDFVSQPLRASRRLNRESRFLENSPGPLIKLKDLFVLPSQEEILEVKPYTVEIDETMRQRHGDLFRLDGEFHETGNEAPVKERLPFKQRIAIEPPQPVGHEADKQITYVRNFKDALRYDGKCERMLAYFSTLLKIMQLEFFIGKLPSNMSEMM